jgi:hypothetical protein
MFRIAPQQLLVSVITLQNAKGKMGLKGFSAQVTSLFFFFWLLFQFHSGPVCFVGIEFHYNNYNLDKTN